MEKTGANSQDLISEVFQSKARSKSEVSRVNLIFSVGFLTILALTGLSRFNSAQSFTDLYWVSHTHEVLTNLEEITTSTQRTVSQQREYLTTGKDQYRTEYESEEKEIIPKLYHLRFLVSDNPIQLQRLDALIPDVTRLLIRLKITAELKAEGKHKEVVRKVAEGESYQLYEKIQDKISDMEDEETRLLEERSSQATFSQQKTLRFISLGGVIALIFFLIARYLLIAEYKKQSHLNNFLTELSLAMEHAVDGVAKLSPHGTFISVNSSYSKITGFSPSELLGKHWSSTIFPDDYTEVTHKFQEMLQQGKSIVEARGVRPDQSIFFQNLTLVSILGAEGQVIGFYFFISDITEHKNLIQSLQESEATFKGAFEEAPIGIALTDLKGNWLKINTTWSQMLEYSKNDLVGKFSLDCVHPEDREKVRLTFSDFMLEQKQSFKLEARYLSKSGKTLWVMVTVSLAKDSEGEPSYFIAEFMDVTEKKNAEHALLLEQEQLKQIVRSAPVAIAMFDKEMQYVVHSEMWLKEYELENKSVIGKSHFDLMPQVTAEEKNKFQLALRGETLSKEEDVRILKDGSKSYYRWAIHPWRNSAGLVGGIIVVTQTIDDLVKSRETALEIAKIKSDFLANMSHEIRTPINGVIGMTNLLLDTKLSDHQREFAETVKLSADTLLTLINDILDFSKLEAGKVELEIIDFDLERLLHDTKRLLSLGATRKGIQLKIESSKLDSKVFKGDPGRINQVLINLVSNAIKFTSNGEVTIQVLEVGSDGQTENLNDNLTGKSKNHGLNNQRRIRFEVSDTGIGIPPEALNRLFLAFSQADASTTRRYGGTGLGLSICKKLVTLMQGDIGVTSQIGTGSTFWFELDLQPSQAKPDATIEPETTEAPAIFGSQGSKSNHPARTKIPHVLVAEDNITNQKVAVYTLEKLGYRATAVANGSEAIDALRNIPFDLVLMDCQMPEMDGFHATAVIRKSTSLPNPKVPIIAMTANAMEGDREKCLKSGMNDYVSKPVKENVLDAMIRKWLPSEDYSIILDMSVIDDLKSLKMGDGSNAFLDIASSFLQGSDERLSLMRKALVAQDRKSLEIEAHTLKSSSGNVGILSLPLLCRELEAQAREGSLDGATELLQQITKEYVRASEALRALMQSSSEQPTPTRIAA